MLEILDHRVQNPRYRYAPLKILLISRYGDRENAHLRAEYDAIGSELKQLFGGQLDCDPFDLI